MGKTAIKVAIVAALVIWSSAAFAEPVLQACQPSQLDMLWDALKPIIMSGLIAAGASAHIAPFVGHFDEDSTFRFVRTFIDALGGNYRNAKNGDHTKAP